MIFHMDEKSAKDENKRDLLLHGDPHATGTQDHGWVVTRQSLGT